LCLQVTAIPKKTTVLSAKLKISATKKAACWPLIDNLKIYKILERKGCPDCTDQSTSAVVQHLVRIGQVD
jgi:hypothetical protein